MEYDPVLYDLDPRPFLKEEVDFYIELVNTLKPSSILELGVGTGRIFSNLLSLVDSAIGIDISESMLKKCKEVCSQYNNFKLHKMNFVNFDLQENFDMIYLPFNTFQHLLSEEDQIHCLRNISKHMNINSTFILDVMNGDNLPSISEEWKEDYSNNLDNGNVIKREQKTLDIDEKKSIVHKKFRYTETGFEVVKRRGEFDALMKITPNNILLNLIEMSGFVVQTMWTDYNFDQDESNKKRIYLLKRYEI